MKKGTFLVGLIYKVTYRDRATNKIYTANEVISYEPFDEYYGATDEYRTKIKIRHRINKLTLRKYFKKHFPNWIIYEIETIG